VLLPFLTRGYEGFDINSEYDWDYASNLAASRQSRLPTITQFPYLLQEVNINAGNQAHP